MSVDGFILSPNTADRLIDKLDERPGASKGGALRGGPARQDCFIRVVSWNDTTKQGTCVVDEFNGSTLSWESVGDSSQTLLLAANNETLTTGKRYFAVRYGNNSGTYSTMGTAVFMAVSPSIGGGSSGSSGSGNGVCLLDDVWCNNGGVYGSEVRLTGYVSIGGTQFPVTFQTSTNGCGSTSGSGG